MKMAYSGGTTKMLDDFKAELKRPANILTLVTCAIGIIVGIATGAYFYYLSIKAGTVYYQVNQVQAFDQSSVSRTGEGTDNPLSVVDDKGNRINSNVYAAVIKVWNGGNDEVKKADVRLRFKLNIEGKPSYQNVSLIGATRNNVDKFALDGAGTIDWEHFDQNEGFLVRVIYASEKQTRIAITGYAVNATGPVEVSGASSSRGSAAVSVIGGIFLAMCFQFVSSYMKRLEKDVRAIRSRTADQAAIRHALRRIRVQQIRAIIMVVAGAGIIGLIIVWVGPALAPSAPPL